MRTQKSMSKHWNINKYRNRKFVQLSRILAIEVSIYAAIIDLIFDVQYTAQLNLNWLAMMINNHWKDFCSSCISLATEYWEKTRKQFESIYKRICVYINIALLKALRCGILLLHVKEISNLVSLTKVNIFS